MILVTKDELITYLLMGAKHNLVKTKKYKHKEENLQIGKMNALARLQKDYRLANV